jgi:hypothetical protein
LPSRRPAKCFLSDSRGPKRFFNQLAFSKIFALLGPSSLFLPVLGLFWPEMFFKSIRVLGKNIGFSIRAGPK